MLWGCISAHGVGDCIIHEGTIDTEAYVGILEGYMLSSWRWLVLGTPCLFQQCNARLHSARIPTAWLHRHSVCVWLTWLQSRSVSYWKCMEHHEEENQIRWPWTVEQLKSCTLQDWAKTATIDIFTSQMITVQLKEKVNWLLVNMPLSQLFLSVLQASILKCVYI